MGLSPAEGARDAGGVPATARIVDADLYGYLTTARVAFPEAAVSQDIARRHDPAGNPLPATNWPVAAATVAWTAAFADNGAEGLVIRISLTNPGISGQKFFVDLLGGLDRPDPLFSLTDFSVEPDAEGRGLPFRHKKLDNWFAITAQQGDFASRGYAVSGDVFAPSANACSRDQAGAPVPGAVTAAPAWALTRLSGISVEAGETRTLVLAVGIGRDSDGALVSARTLLAATEERQGGAGGPNLFAQAQKAHDAARYRSGSAAIDGLMAQSLVNVPFHDLRRVGVGSREFTPYYQPGVGGWMALGWAVARPDWSVAQLNAWFVTETPLQTTIRRTISPPPTDVFVLWDLVQRTHDRDMLEKFYPYAVQRFQQFLESGRERGDAWLFAWPVPKDPLRRARARRDCRVPAPLPRGLAKSTRRSFRHTLSWAPECCWPAPRR